MSVYKKLSAWIVCLHVVFLLVKCTSNINTVTPTSNETVDSCTVLVQAEDFITSKSGVEALRTEDNVKYVTATKGGWLEYKVAIPVAGRYRVQLFAQTTDSSPINSWIEDYADNKNGRNYNITGNVLLKKLTDSTNFNMVQVEGSPLDTGIHHIRLYYDSGEVMIDRICFSLVKPHKSSPQILTQQTTGKEWKLTWSDEFNGQGLPDTGKWVFDIGNWGWGNNELQYYTAGRTENARQENGNLVIEARKNDYGFPWTSARLTTRGKQSFLYGKIEFRAKVPVGRGTWSAGWLLGDSYVDESSWPVCGEIDVLETVGYENDSITGDGKAHATIHCGAYYFKLNNQPSKMEPVKNMHLDYHTYTIEWLPESMKIFIDGKPYFDYHDTSTPLSWPFDKPQNLILNLAMGGGWGGKMGVDTTLNSQKFMVDYVRVYARQ